jgi:glycosyltransferase involved in cell wall biosynthesis
LKKKPVVLLPIPSVPYPLVSGGHLRDWQILNLLNNLGIQPHLIYFGAGQGHELDPGSPVFGLAKTVQFGGHRVEQPISTVPQVAQRKLAYLLSSNPRSFPSSYQYDAINAGSVIAKAARQLNADVVILRNMWCHYADELAATGCRVIINCPDFNTKLARQMIKAVRNPLKKIGPICNYAAVRRQERRFFPRSDEIWIPTDAEASEISQFARHVQRLVLPNLVDVSSMPDLSEKPVNSTIHSLLFVGNFSYLPNANGARRLLEQVMPEIRRRKPDVELLLVGAGLPEDLKVAAAALGRVRVTGFVESVHEYYATSTIVVLPVREGAGMLFKALEALALGKPAVGYRESFRGIDPTGPVSFISVDSDDEMAHAIVQLLDSAPARRDLGARARAYAESSLSWEFGATVLSGSRTLFGETYA